MRRRHLPAGRVGLGLSGHVYLATVIDLCSRRVVGWSIAEHTRTELIADAIEAVVAARGGNVAGVVFHSDRGAQYCSAEFNAAAESLFASLKRELLHGKRYTSVARMRLDVFEWLTYYNTRRRHSTIGYQTPAAYERQMIIGKLATFA